MITQDEIDKVKKLKAKRYSQSRVAKELGISISTVARYWHSGEKLSGGKLTPKQYNLGALFYIGRCRNCSLVYPMPKFLYSWNCPGCNEPVQWKSCWYKPAPSTAKSNT